AAAVAHPGDPEEQVAARLRGHPADHDDRGVEQVDPPGDEVADVAARLSDGLARGDAPAPHEVDDLRGALDLDALGAERLDDRLAAGQRLEAADVAAAAGDLPAARHRDVAEVPGGAEGAAAQLAVGDDARADPGGDLDEDE